MKTISVWVTVDKTDSPETNIWPAQKPHLDGNLWLSDPKEMLTDTPIDICEKYRRKLFTGIKRGGIKRFKITVVEI